MTREHMAALGRFALAHGRCWKSDLRVGWMQGYWPLVRNRGDIALLQQLRNAAGFGPAWLVRFKLPKEA